MSDASVALQQAIYTVVSGLGYATYDRVSPDCSFPFFVIGDDSAIDDGTKTKDGQQFTAQVHAYSRYRGRKEVKEMNAAARGKLHQQPLAVAGFHVIEIECDDQRVLADPEPDTWHGITRYRITVEPL